MMVNKQDFKINYYCVVSLILYGYQILVASSYAYVLKRITSLM